MKEMNCDVVIVGAGLTGLSLAYFFKRHNLKVVVLEARNRVGGRILTQKKQGEAPVEMGATWMNIQHTHLLELFAELEVNTFDQKMGETAIYEAISTSPYQLVSLPDGDSPSYRVQQGTQQVIAVLVGKIGKDSLQLGQSVTKIAQVNDTIIAHTSTHAFCAQFVVATLPPMLFENTIVVEPPLPLDLCNVAKTTHTWMGDSIKIALTFKERFWDEEGLSGTIFSNTGPIQEMYDHSNVKETRFALMGFLNGAFYGISKAERKVLVLSQLERYYGNRVKSYLSYEEVVWKNEKYTATDSTEYILPHQNNGHAVYQKAYMNGCLYLAGTETSPLHSGYMEGAVVSAKNVYKKLCKDLGLA